MAGTLTISTLSDGTNSTSSTNCIQGSAKAWANWNGSGGAIRGSFNVSSITINGTGDYTINFTNAVTNANYSAVGSCGTASGGADFTFKTYAYTTTTCRVGTSANATQANPTFVNAAIFSL